MNYSTLFPLLKQACLTGTGESLDYLFSHLHDGTDLPTTRAIDFFLGLVETEEGYQRIEWYLFNGTQIQRNYCTLYFARRNDWKIVRRAYDAGLIDRIQAWSR